MTQQRTYSGIKPDESGLIFEPDLVYRISDVREEEIIDPDGGVTVQWSFIIDEKLTYAQYTHKFKTETDEIIAERDEMILDLDAGLCEALDRLDRIDPPNGGDD